MAFWDDAKKKVQQFMKPRQEEGGDQLVSNRADGGFSGYVPKTKPVLPEQPVNAQAEQDSMAGMMPVGVDRNAFQHVQPAGGQTGAMPQAGMPQQGIPQAGMPQQPRFKNGFQQPVRTQQPFNTGYQQPVHTQQPYQPQVQQPMQQPVQQPYQPQMQQPVQQPYQPQVQQPVQQPQAANNGHTFMFPGDVEADGSAYKLIFRVAQITGVPSCFRVIEFMYNNEAVIVNAEQVTDLVEADRCMDLIFGAACAMKQRLIRVSGKQIYLITPPQVYVAPFDSIRRMGMEDIDHRWPGALQMNMQPQATQGGFMGQARQTDYTSGFGRHASRPTAGMGYVDYSYGAHTR